MEKDILARLMGEAAKVATFKLIVLAIVFVTLILPLAYFGVKKNPLGFVAALAIIVFICLIIFVYIPRSFYEGMLLSGGRVYLYSSKALPNGPEGSLGRHLELELGEIAEAKQGYRANLIRMRTGERYQLVLYRGMGDWLSLMNMVKKAP